MEFYPDKVGEIICFDWMARYVQKYMECTNALVKCIPFDVVEKELLDN